jgi:ribosomal protein S18 acetylase RimI-like enzyme
MAESLQLVCFAWDPADAGAIRGGVGMGCQIVALNPADFGKCGNIWDMEKHAKLAGQFYQELISGNRIPYVYVRGNEYLGEISLVFDKDDPDYTRAGRRIYVSRLLVKPEERRRGIGTDLIRFSVCRAREMSYSEMSIGVDLDNYPALELYTALGFNQVICVDEDEQGKYIKLMKRIE